MRPIPFVRAGVTVTRNKVRVPDGALGIVAVARPSGTRVYAELVAPSPRVRGFGVDLSLGAGREATTISVTGDTFESNRQTAAFMVEERTVQTFVQTTAELVTPRLTSYFVRVTTRTLPGLATPAIRLDADDFPGIVAYQLQASSVTFGRVREVSFGTRFRF